MIKNKTSIIEISCSKYILLPSSIYHDSAFPFKKIDKLEMEIFGKRLIIRKAWKAWKSKKISNPSSKCLIKKK